MSSEWKRAQTFISSGPHVFIVPACIYSSPEVFDTIKVFKSWPPKVPPRFSIISPFKMGSDRREKQYIDIGYLVYDLMAHQTHQL